MFPKLPKKPNSTVSVFDVFFVLTAILGFILINLFRITNWYYVSIGDEYEFWRQARAIVQGARPDFFSQNGAYGIIPVASSYYQAMVMTIFGQNLVGFKLAGIFAVAFSLIPVYGISKILFSRRIAVFVTIITASSHYLWAYARTGYPNVESIPLMLFSIWFFLMALEKTNPVWGLIAGVIAGAGWYTFYSSRITIGILGLWYLFHKNRLRNLKIMVPLIFGFLIALIPLFKANGLAVLTSMAGRSLSNPFPATSMTPMQHFWSNIFLSLKVWFSYQNDGHFPFVNGALLDPVSGLLFLLGAGVFLINYFKYPFIAIWIWFWICLVTAGGMSQYVYPTISRLNLLVPVISLFTGFSLDRIYDRVKFISARTKPYIFGVVLSVIGIYNFYHFFYSVPQGFPTTSESVIVKAVQNFCQTQNLNPFAVVRDPSGSTLNFINQTDLLMKPVILHDPEANLDGFIQNFRSSCLIVESNYATLAQITDIITKLNPQVFYVSDNTQRVKVMVLIPSHN